MRELLYPGVSTARFKLDTDAECTQPLNILAELLGDNKPSAPPTLGVNGST